MMKRLLAAQILAVTLYLPIDSPAFATDATAANKPAMSLVELEVKAGKSDRYRDMIKTISRSAIENEPGTLALYAFRHQDNPYLTYRVEVYADDEAYKKHLASRAYQAFIQQAPEVVAKERKTELVPQFLGDKRIVQDEKTIDNLVIVDVKPEHQQAFKNIVLPEMAESLKVEEGVLAMYAATDAQNTRRWYFYEIYASAAAYQQHRATPHFRAYIAQTAQMSARKESVPVTPVLLTNKGGIRPDKTR